MTTAYLNGTFLPLEAANISAMDRGFLFGDSIYEVIPVYNGKLFRFDEHMQRLQNSLQLIQLNAGLDSAEWQALFEQLVEKNGGGHLSLYLQVSRGAAIPRNHVIPTEYKPTIFAYAIPYPEVDAETAKQGMKVVTMEDMRWRHCDIKSTNLLANILAYSDSKTQGVDDAILIRDGIAYEGCSSNLFVVKHGELYTTPLGPHILPGITRDVVLELARANGVVCHEAFIRSHELGGYDEVWLCSSTREIKPVTMINDQAIGTEEAGPLWLKMYEWFQTFKRNW